MNIYKKNLIINRLEQDVEQKNKKYQKSKDALQELDRQNKVLYTKNQE